MTSIQTAEDRQYPIEVRQKLWQNRLHPSWPIDLNERDVPLYMPLGLVIPERSGAQLLASDAPLREDEMKQPRPIDFYTWLLKKQPDIVMVSLDQNLPEPNSEKWTTFRSAFIDTVSVYAATAPSHWQPEATELLEKIQANFIPTRQWDWHTMKHVYTNALVAPSLKAKAFYRNEPAQLKAERFSHMGLSSVDTYLTLPVSVQLVDASDPFTMLTIPHQASHDYMLNMLQDAFPDTKGYNAYGDPITAKDVFRNTLAYTKQAVEETLGLQLAQRFLPTLPSLFVQEGFQWNQDWNNKEYFSPDWKTQEPDRMVFGQNPQDVGLFYPADIKLLL